MRMHKYQNPSRTSTFGIIYVNMRKLYRQKQTWTKHFDTPMGESECKNTKSRVNAKTQSLTIISGRAGPVGSCRRATVVCITGHWHGFVMQHWNDTVPTVTQVDSDVTQQMGLGSLKASTVLLSHMYSMITQVQCASISLGRSPAWSNHGWLSR